MYPDQPLREIIQVAEIPTEHDLKQLITHIQTHGKLPAYYLILKLRSESPQERATRQEIERYSETFL